MFGSDVTTPDVNEGAVFCCILLMYDRREADTCGVLPLSPPLPARMLDPLLRGVMLDPLLRGVLEGWLEELWLAFPGIGAVNTICSVRLRSVCRLFGYECLSKLD